MDHVGDELIIVSEPAVHFFNVECRGIRAACAAGGAIGLLGIAVLVLVAHRSGIVWSHGPAV